MNQENRNRKTDVLEIDLFDILGEILSRFIWGVLALLLGVGLIFGYNELTERKKANVTEEMIESAKSLLSPTQIEQVENTFRQYVSYKQYLVSLQSYLADSMYGKGDFDNLMIRYSMYCVDSDIKGADQIFINTAFSPEDYAYVSRILLGEESDSGEIYQLISLTNFSEISTASLTIDERSDKSKTILCLSVIGESQEKIDDAAEYLEAVLEEKTASLQENYRKVDLIRLGSEYSHDVLSFIQDKQTDLIISLNTANTALTSLESGVIAKMDSESRTYYNYLQQQYDQEEGVVKQSEFAKNLLKGLIVGFLLFVIWLVFSYILTDTIKTGKEIHYYWDEGLPYTIQMDKSGSSLHIFKKLARWIRGEKNAKDADELVAADVINRLGKTGGHTLYIISASDKHNDYRYAQEFCEAVKNRCDGLDIQTGLPLLSSEDLTRLAHEEAAVIVAELNVTKRKEVIEMVQYCLSYGVKIIGVVTVRG